MIAWLSVILPVYSLRRCVFSWEELETFSERRHIAWLRMYVIMCAILTEGHQLDWQPVLEGRVLSFVCFIHSIELRETWEIGFTIIFNFWVFSSQGITDIVCLVGVGRRLLLIWEYVLWSERIACTWLRWSFSILSLRSTRAVKMLKVGGGA